MQKLAMTIWAYLAGTRQKFYRNLTLFLLFGSAYFLFSPRQFPGSTDSYVPWHYAVPFTLIAVPVLVLQLQLSIGGRNQAYYGRAFWSCMIATALYWSLGIVPGLLLPPGSWSGVPAALFSPILWVLVIYLTWPKKKDRA